MKNVLKSNLKKNTITVAALFLNLIMTGTNVWAHAISKKENSAKTEAVKILDTVANAFHNICGESDFCFLQKKDTFGAKNEKLYLESLKENLKSENEYIETITITRLENTKEEIINQMKIVIDAGGLREDGERNNPALRAILYNTLEQTLKITNLKIYSMRVTGAFSTDFTHLVLVDLKTQKTIILAGGYSE